MKDKLSFQERWRRFVPADIRRFNDEPPPPPEMRPPPPPPPPPLHEMRANGDRRE